MFYNDIGSTSGHPWSEVREASAVLEMFCLLIWVAVSWASSVYENSNIVQLQVF